MSRRLMVALLAMTLLFSACATQDDGAGQAEAVLVGDDAAQGQAEGTVIPSDTTDASSGESADEAATDTADSGSSTGSDGSGAATGATAASGERVDPPQCEPGPRNAFSSEAPADVETITVNQVVEGSIEAFSVDTWKIDLCQGQRVFFDGLPPCDGQDGDWLQWRLLLPNGEEAHQMGDLINSANSCGGDYGPVEITESGEHLVHVGYRDAADQEASLYRFEVINLPPPDEFTVTFGDVIDESLGAGAGRIELPGAIDRYLIDLEEGDRIHFDIGEDCLGGDGTWLIADLIAPDGYEVVDSSDIINSAGSCGDFGPVSIPETGQYALVVSFHENNGATADRYSLEVRDAG